MSETGCKIIIKVQFSEKTEIGVKEKKEGGGMFGDAQKEEELGINDRTVTRKVNRGRKRSLNLTQMLESEGKGGNKGTLTKSCFHPKGFRMRMDWVMRR